MKVAIYIRVSTKLQEDRYSLSAQKEELTRHAKNQGWDIVGYYQDVDSGGVLDKAGLNKLLDDVEDGEIGIVLCVDQDRLSRLDMAAWEYLKDILRQNSVKIAEPTGKITDLKNEDDEFVSDIYNLIARREKRSIVRRMMRGAKQRVRQGKAWGRLPAEYIYDEVAGAYKINEKWSWVIPYIDQLYLEKNMGYKDIANRLNEICSSPNGTNWSFEAVRHKLNSKSYHGVLEATISGEFISSPDIFPPLRTEETYYKIERKRKKRYRSKPRSKTFLISDIHITCEDCNRKLGIQMGGNKKDYYIRHSVSKDCKIFINVIRVEKNIIKAIEDILSNENMAKRYLKLEYSQDDVKELIQDINRTRSIIKETQEKIDRLLDLYLDGSFPREQLDKRKGMLEEELKVHEDQLISKESKKRSIENNIWTYDALHEYLSIAHRFDVEFTITQQSEMISKLFPRGNLDIEKKKLTLFGELPGNIPLEIELPISDTI